MNKINTSEEKLFSKFSHDLRGSFVSILGYSSILSDPNEEVSEIEVKEFAARIDYRAKETYELLESFTNWLKLERYPDAISKEEINLFENVTSVYTLFEKDFNKKKPEVNFNFDKSILVLFDIQIIQSLLKNIFSFILKSVEEKSQLNISSIKTKKYSNLQFEYNSILSEKEILPLVKLKNNIIEYTNVSNEILFAKKFIELCGGSFSLDVSDEKHIIIVISLKII